GVAVGARAPGAGRRPVVADRRAAREAVRRDPRVVVTRARGDVDRAVGGVGLEVEAAASAWVVEAAAGVAEGEGRCARVAGVDLDDRRDGGGVADVVGAGEG